VGGATSHTRRLWQFFFLSPKTHTHTQQNTADRRRFVSKTRDEEVGQERRKKRERKKREIAPNESIRNAAL
jgi:hypothetical protein